MVKYHSVLWSVLILVLAACQPAKESNVKITAQCLSSQSPCVVKTAQGDFTVLFDVDPLFTESAFEVTVRYQGRRQVAKISGHIEGSKMFMGKYPLFFATKASNQQEKPSFTATSMLGSCAEPDMRWRMWIRADFTDAAVQNHLSLASKAKANQNQNQQTQDFFIEFSSTRS
jgi:hypothetical protein